jgi:hypothetical protein
MRQCSFNRGNGRDGSLSNKPAWISNQILRQEVTAMTNKVEGYHGFSKWLRFGGEVVSENDPDEQQKYIRYNDLLASAVILQNVLDMSTIVADLRAEG